MKWDVSYRENEIGAVVEADTEDEAIQKFLAGDVLSSTINYWALWSDFVEAVAEGG